MNIGWDKLKLGQVISLEYGKPLPDSERCDYSEYPAYGANGIKCYSIKPYCSEESIVVGRKGTAGAVNLVSAGFWPLDVTFFVKFDSCKYDIKFIYYQLIFLDLPSLATGVKPGINRNVVYDLDVEIPSLLVQKRIVTSLDEAFEGIDTAIANTEKNLANARELFESYLKSVFNQQGEGWRVESVSEFSHHCLGKMLDKKKNKGELRPYLRNINVRWFEVATDDILEMRIENHEQERFLVEKGDLLICEGGYPGRAAIWEKDDPIYFQKALHRVRCKDSRLNWWLLYYLFLSDATGGLKSHFTGAGIQHFTGKALKSFAVPLPPEELVDELLKGIASIREEVRRLESIYQQKLTALAELKQSLLQKAFSGELTVSAAGSDTITEEADFA